MLEHANNIYAEGKKEAHNAHKLDKIVVKDAHTLIKTDRDNSLQKKISRARSHIRQKLRQNEGHISVRDEIT